MKTTSKFLSLCLLISLFISCEKSNNNNDCEPQELPVKSLETEYGCSNTKYQLYSTAPNEGFIIIRNQADFDSQTDDPTCRPQIDFDTYDLVIGKKQLTSGNESIAYQYFDDCTSKTLTVTFFQNETLIAPNIIYHALIPKLEPSEQIEVEFVIN